MIYLAVIALRVNDGRNLHFLQERASQAAAHLAKILECYGCTVWYDYRLVKGDDFDDQIDVKIKEAKAAVDAKYMKGT